MKIYTFKLVVQEGNDEFWEGLTGKAGCDEVLEAIKDCLDEHGWTEDSGTILTLVEYKQEEA